MRRGGSRGSACFILNYRAKLSTGICGLVVEFIVAIDETRVRFPADALFIFINKSSQIHRLFYSNLKRVDASSRLIAKILLKRIRDLEGFQIKIILIKEFKEKI